MSETSENENERYDGIELVEAGIIEKSDIGTKYDLDELSGIPDID